MSVPRLLLCAASHGAQRLGKNEMNVLWSLTWGGVRPARGRQAPRLCTHIGDLPRAPGVWGKERATRRGF